MKTWNELLLNLESLLKNSQDKSKWYKEGLERIAESKGDKNPFLLVGIAKSYLDGEPTTADEFNESQEIEMSELKNQLESQSHLPPVPIITGDRDTDALLEDERIAQEGADDINAQIHEYDKSMEISDSKWNKIRMEDQ